MKNTEALIGRRILAYIGDGVWDFMVLKHQYAQSTPSPWMSSWSGRSRFQASITRLLHRGHLLTKKERAILWWGTTYTTPPPKSRCSTAEYAASRGFCTLLGFMYLDTKSSDERLKVIACEIGLMTAQGEENRMLQELTGGIFTPREEIPAVPTFDALAPLGHVVLRLYISRYVARRCPRPPEFVCRVSTALYPEEVEEAALGFLRDDATQEEAQLMKQAMSTGESYGFAFECLLGYLSIEQPYRLHQVVASFGWAVKLEGT